MHKSRQQQQQQYDSSDEEIQESIGNDVDNMTPEQLEEHMLTMYKPVSASDMKRVHVIKLRMEINGSAHQFQDQPSKTIWKIRTDHASEFLDNLAVHNRNKPKPNELVGSANRILPLGMRITNQQNTHSYSIGIRVPGLRDRTLTGNDKFVHVIGSMQPLSAPVDIFDPDHIINKYQYENSILCSSADLDRDLVHTDSGRTRIAVGSFPHMHLREMIDARAFSRDELKGMDLAKIMEPGPDHDVQVPRSVGERIEKEIRPFVEDSARGMIDATNWNMSIHRADGQKSWNSSHNLIGSFVAGKAVDKSTVDDTLLHKVCTVSIDFELKYVTH